jgi:AraC-like DNA-binding protein
MDALWHAPAAAIGAAFRIPRGKTGIVVTMQQFSSDALPERKRMSALHDFADQFVARRDFKAIDADIRADVEAMPIDHRALVAKARYSPIIGKRSRSHLADGRNDYLVTVHSADYELSVDGAQPVAVRAGDMTLITEASASEFRLPAVDVDVIAFQRSALASLVPGLESVAWHHLPAGSAGAELLRGYARLIRSHSGDTQRLELPVATHLLELAAFAFRDSVKRETGWRAEGLKSARLALVKQAIDERLREHDLDIASIARGQRISSRYVQQLFKEAGTTFSEFLRERRLELARRLIEDGNPNDVRISSVAYEAGFGDLSHFNREFRRRFGATPSQLRARALTDRRFN